MSRPPSEVHQERQEIISELSNVTQKRIVVDGIRYHIDAMGRIREEWSDLYFHAVDTETQAISPVDSILNVIDTHYDFLKVCSMWGELFFSKWRKYLRSLFVASRS